MPHALQPAPMAGRASARGPPVPARFTEAEARGRREEILAACGRVFAQKGYKGATVNDLEEVTGLSRGGIFFHFPSKRDLYFATVQRCALEGQPYVGRAVLQSTTAEDALLTALRAIIQWHREHPDALAFFHQLHANRGDDPDLAELDDRITAQMSAFAADIVRTLQGRGVFNPAIDADAAARLLHGVMDHLMELALAHPAGPAAGEETARRIFHVLTEGLRAREP